MTTYSMQRRARGFTLVEVMVALIIIAIGMLGIAKMQGLALSSTGASRSRALAAIEASSLASAMQANRNYWSSAGSLPGNITVTTSTGTATVTSDSASMTTALNAVKGGTQCGGMGQNLSCFCVSGSSCSAVNMAASDLYDWAQSLATFLPNATATLACAVADTPVDCTMVITWNENTVASNTQQASAGTTVPVSFTLYVVP
jgi:type IV pilus assembly protein PilV